MVLEQPLAPRSAFNHRFADLATQAIQYMANEENAQRISVRAQHNRFGRVCQIE